MSTSLTVYASDAAQLGFAVPQPTPPTSRPTVLKRALIFALAGAAFGAGVFAATRFADAAASVVDPDVRVSSVKRQGFFEDIIEGRLINEGSGAEVYLWVEWKDEPGCARHTYVRADSEYNFSFLCDRLTFNNGGELRVFSSASPPDWVRRTAKSL